MTRQIKNPLRALDADFVRMLLAACDNRFLTVDVVKKDGTLGTYNGNLRPMSRIVGKGAASERQTATLKAHDLIPMHDYNRERATGRGWISFKADRVVGIRCEGADIAVGTRA